MTFTRCPFRSTIEPEQLPLVCSMHRGFLDGYLDAFGSNLVTDELQIGPKLCHATFEVASDDAERSA